jgi:predicted short-subunit dehydrogenase-like oxidoreductase (DUF2520 family)
LKTLNVIGCGRVGQTLAALLHQHGVCEVQDLYSRTPTSAAQAAAFVGAGQVVASLAAMRPADVWLLSVPDGQIAEVAAQLAAAQGPAMQGVVVWHNSGFWSSQTLDALHVVGATTASVHPVLSFATPASAVAQFAGTLCGMEGQVEALAVLRPWVVAIGGQGFEIVSDKKPLYHAAAVFCSNFTVVLQAVAQEAWRASGVSADLLVPLTQALLQSSVNNVLHMGPQQALTGPAARGDTAVVKLQTEVVQAWQPRAGEVYALLSEMATRLKRTGAVLGEPQS